MSSTKTRSDLISEVLDQLGVLAAGQTPAAEDVAKVDGKLDAVLAELSALDIVTIDDAGAVGPSGGEIASEAFLSLATAIAYRCAAAFGLANDPALYVLSQRAEKMLRTIVRPGRATRTLRTDAQLRGRRVAAGRGSYSRGP